MGTINLWQRSMTGMVLLAVMTAAVVTTPAQAQTAAPADEWKFSITPYLWLPNINGTLKYSIPPGAQGSPEVETGPNDYLQNLQAIMLLSGEVRKDRWTVFADLIYLGFAKESSSVKTIDFGGSVVSSSFNLATSSWLRGTNVTVGAGYAVKTGKAASLDVFGGLRYFDLSAGTDWQLNSKITVTGSGGGSLEFPAAGTISRSMTFLDGIIGIKGQYQLGSGSWSVPYYLDVGTGTAIVTYQAMLGIAYTFGWGDVTLAYRDLYFDQKADKFVQDLRFSGPTLGATFRF